MSYITLLGLFAAACTTSAFIPQVIKAYKTKQTKDISLGMYIVLMIGIASWLIYGIVIQDIPVTIANGVTLLLVVLILKIKYG